MRKERYIHDESYIEVLTTTKAVVVRIFHAHVFDFTYKKQLHKPPSESNISEYQQQQPNNDCNCRTENGPETEY